MDYISSLFSVLFFLGALVSIFWGVSIIRLDVKSDVNRAFFVLCLALSVWSFGFAMANISLNLDHALFWRRFASSGMVPLFGIILHFLLLITRDKEDRKLKKARFLLHIPALIFLYAFTFSSKMATVQYDLLKTSYGLTNVAPNSIWNYFYYLYYFLYLIVSLSIVWNWKKRINEEVKIRQANIIFITILFATILGSLTDIVSSTFMTNPLPQIAPLLILIPVWAMYYSANYFDLIDYKKISKIELILTEKEKSRIFYSISFAFILGGSLSFLFEYSLFMQNIKEDFTLGFFKKHNVLYHRYKCLFNSRN